MIGGERMKKDRMVLILAVMFLFSFHLSTVVLANVDDSDVDQQFWWKKDREKEDFPELRGGPEKQERKRQMPVDMNLLQQQYPETFILQGPTDQTRVALTFDDGPDPRYTEDVLNVLSEYNVPATFFVLGSRAAAYPELVVRMINEAISLPIIHISIRI